VPDFLKETAMYLVKALAAAAFPLALDQPNVQWAALEQRLIDDNIVSRYREHSDVFTVVTGPNMTDIIAALVGADAGVVAGAVNGATVSASEGSPKVQRTVLTLTATPVTIADDAGVAQYGGTGKIYDFPAGLIQILGAEVHGSLTLGTTGTIINTFSGVVALGSAAAGTGATLTGTEADVMASNAVAAATLKVATIDGVSTGVAAPLDGTATAKDLYLNVAIADDATHTAGTGTFTGVVTLTWINLGDN
jgi:hypothetical protein